MTTHAGTQVVQWQDFRLMSESEVVLKIAQEDGWKDCMVFGHGDMITQPVESTGWKLIPADLYEYSIPSEGVKRILRIINAGVRIQGVIIADDLRTENIQRSRVKPSRSVTTAQQKSTSPEEILIAIPFISVIVLMGLIILPFIILAELFGALSSENGFHFDPQLVILVDDGNGGMVWVSIYTWFD